MTDDIDPGVRELVALLNSWGFETSDSGDGAAKFEAEHPMECALEFPNVTIVTDLFCLVSEAVRLAGLLEKVGVVIQPIGPDGPQIQATFDPANNSAVILLAGVVDGMLKPSRTDG